jgi:hypothetical protein
VLTVGGKRSEVVVAGLGAEGHRDRVRPILLPVNTQRKETKN